jgi:hypothetical protein
LYSKCSAPSILYRLGSLKVAVGEGGDNNAGSRTGSGSGKLSSPHSVTHQHHQVAPPSQRSVIIPGHQQQVFYGNGLLPCPPIPNGNFVITVPGTVPGPMPGLYVTPVVPGVQNYQLPQHSLLGGPGQFGGDTRSVVTGQSSPASRGAAVAGRRELDGMPALEMLMPQLEPVSASSSLSIATMPALEPSASSMPALEPAMAANGTSSEMEMAQVFIGNFPYGTSDVSICLSVG